MNANNSLLDKMWMKFESPMAKVLDHIANYKQTKLICSLITLQKTEHSRSAPFTWNLLSNF